MHAADILAGVHGVPVAPAGRDHQAFHVGLGMRGLLPDEAPEPARPGAAGRRYRVLERPCATAPVYPADQDPGRDILAWPRSPEATASFKVAERLSDCARAGKSTACGVVSLRRHCPDQVPGGRRSASELSPASQLFLPAPGLPGTPFGPAPSITSQTIFRLHGAGAGA